MDNNDAVPVTKIFFILLYDYVEDCGIKLNAKESDDY
jgi:hypothetical protein